MRKLKYYLLFIIMISSTRFLSAQTLLSKEMNLQELFDLAENNNRQLKIADFKTQIAEEAINEERKKLLPSLDVTLTLSYNGDGTISNRNFTNSFTAEIPSYGNNFVFEAKQLIYAGGALHTSIAMAKNNSALTRLNKEKDRQNIRLMISGFYLEMLKLNNQKVILEKNKSLTEKLLAQITSKHNEGAALRNNITRYELQLQAINVALLKVNNGSNIINNELLKVLQLPAGKKIIPIDQVSSAINHLPNKENWKEITLSNSVDLKQVAIQIDQAKKAENLAKSEKSPQLFAFAADHLDGPITIEIPNINKNLNYWYVGAGIKYNIASIYKNKTKTNQAKIAIQMAREESELIRDQILTDVQNTEIKLIEMQNIYQTHLKGVQLATQNYNIIKNRYLNNLVLITEMLDAENAKIDAEMQAANAQINILLQYYQLKKLTGTL